MKKILFWISHEIKWDIFWGTELELISGHLDLGNDIFIVYGGDLVDFSLFNINGSVTFKKLSFIRFKKGLSFLKFPLKQILRLYKASIKKRFIFDNINELKKFRYKDFDVGEGVASSIISAFREHIIDTYKYKTIIENMICSSIYIYDFFCDFLSREKFDQVYFFNGRLADQRPVLRACEKTKANFSVFEMGDKIHTYVLFENSWVHSAEYINQKIDDFWNDSRPNKEKVAKAWFLERRNGVQGRFAFTKRQIKYFLPETFDFSKKNIVIFNSSIDEYAAISDMKNTVCEDETVFLKKLLKDFKNNEDVYFYLRLHPNLAFLNNSQIYQLKKLLAQNLEIIWPESLVDSYELMQKSDIVLTFGSTMGLEACFWRKPSILVGRSFYEKLDCCYVPDNYESIVKLLNSNLKAKSKIGALKYAYYLVSRNISYKKFQVDKNCFLNYSLNVLSFKERIYLKLWFFVDYLFH